MVSSNDASDTDLVWTEGMPSWAPLASVIPAASVIAPFGPPPLPAASAGHAGAYPLIPPALHWALVVLFSWISGGLFQAIWPFVQADFVKKIDHSSRALSLLAMSVVGFLIAMGGYVMGVVAMVSSSNTEAQVGVFAVAFLFQIAATVAAFMAYFQMRRSMVNYYNTVEPIGLRLSAPMTFFFNIFYLQYHLTRIAKWKQTGYIEPQ